MVAMRPFLAGRSYNLRFDFGRKYRRDMRSVQLDYDRDSLLALLSDVGPRILSDDHSGLSKMLFIRLEAD